MFVLIIFIFLFSFLCCNELLLKPEIIVNITGDVVVNGVLSGSYTYTSPETLTEKNVTYEWFVSDSSDGDYEPIPGAIEQNYTIPINELNKYIKVRISPSFEEIDETIEPVTSNYVGPVEGSLPTAENVQINGTMQINSTVTATYNFVDIEGDDEGQSTYRWLRCDSANGDYVTIENETSLNYTLTIDDVYKYIKFEVTPVSSVEPHLGYPVRSEAFGPIATEGDNIPEVVNVIISGNAIVGNQLSASYDYNDADGDPEGDSIYEWLISDAVDGTYSPINGANQLSYIPLMADENKYIKFRVTPYSIVPPNPGNPTESNPIGPIEGPSENTWVKMSYSGLTEGVDYPESRTGAVLQYLETNKVLLFGGFNLSDFAIYNDTWFFDVTPQTWTKMDYTGLTEDEDYPTNRASVNISYSGNDKVLLFGGLTWSGSYMDLNDTWIFDNNLNIWSKKDYTGLTEDVDYPKGRTGSAIAYNGFDEVIMFSGAEYIDDDPVGITDMWTFNIMSQIWTKIDLTGLVEGVDYPQTRVNSATAYIGNNKILVFGGLTQTETLGDTWIYEIGTGEWREVVYSGGTAGVDYPEARYYSSIAYTGYNNITVLSNGIYSDIPLDTESEYTDTWIFDGYAETWAKLDYTGLTEDVDYPSARTGSYAAFTNSNKAVMFGGIHYSTDTYLGDTWIFYASPSEF